MIAARYLEVATCIREKASLNVLDPGAVHAQGYFIFALASDGTGMTANTDAVIDDESVVLGAVPGSHVGVTTHKPFLPFRSGDVEV
jgi:hypothetical protein